MRWKKQSRILLDTIIKLVKEYALSMNVSFVKSSQNKADRLTRVPQRWLDAIKRNTGPVQPACTASVDLTRSRLFTDKAVILVCGGLFILWNRLPLGSLRPQWKPSSENVKSVSRSIQHPCTGQRGFEC